MSSSSLSSRPERKSRLDVYKRQLVDFMRYFTGRAIALRAKPRDVAANRPLRMRCELVPGETADVYYLSLIHISHSPW